MGRDGHVALLNRLERKFRRRSTRPAHTWVGPENISATSGAAVTANRVQIDPHRVGYAGAQYRPIALILDRDRASGAASPARTRRGGKSSISSVAAVAVNCLDQHRRRGRGRARRENPLLSRYGQRVLKESFANEGDVTDSNPWLARLCGTSVRPVAAPHVDRYSVQGLLRRNIGVDKKIEWDRARVKAIALVKNARLSQERRRAW